MQRNVITVVLAALLLVIIYIVLAIIVDGYLGGNIWPDALEPDAWSPPDSWAEWRDIVIVFSGFFWALAGIVLIVLLVVLVYLVVAIRELLRENVAPAVDSAKQTLDTVRGTAEFTGETVVSPVIRMYSIFRGVRMGLGAITGVGGRISGNRGKGGRR
jgi:hypothetical protein